VTADDSFIPLLIDAPERKSRFIALSDLASHPPPKPLIGNTIDQGNLAILYGAWGLGKSFLAIDWAACVATGRPWQSRPTERARVLYIAAEGVHGFGKRTHAWQRAWGKAIPDDQFIIYPEPVDLMNRAEVTDLVDCVKAERYGFVVVDTLARCIVGADENTSRDMGVAIDSLDRIRRASGTVLAVHHPGKDGKTLRGSSAVEGAADTVYRMTTDGGGFILDRTKRKDGRLVDRNTFRLVEFADSCIVEASRAEPEASWLPALVASIGELDPPPTSATQAAKRLGVDKRRALQAFPVWSAR
jgi:hypothetical protein